MTTTPTTIRPSRARAGQRGTEAMKKLILLIFLLLPSIAFAGGTITQVTPQGNIKVWTVTDFGPNNRVIMDTDSGTQIMEYRTPELGDHWRVPGVHRQERPDNFLILPEAVGGDE
jgi:hypothetical protein